jgi:ABC-type glycerol-3-phosphate transport system substrate-binding protein
MSPDTYEKDLVEALASGQGPDIFLIQNNWLPKFADKVVPAPQTIITEQKFRNDFVDVVANDFINQGRIYAAPLSVDTLGLYYNKDLFSEAGISAPPKNWADFMEDVRRLTRLGKNGEIVRAGAAIGTSRNINRSTDILNLLMLQNGTEMVNGQVRRALFDQVVKNGDQSLSPGENALNFYTQFAKNSSSVYTWNPSLHYSIDAFSEGAAAMMLNYSWHIDTIAAKSPKLNFAVAPVPQLPNMPAVNYANYWGYAVTKNKISVDVSNANKAPLPDEVRIGEAWKFITFLTTKPEASINVSTNVAGQQKTTAINFDPAVDYLEKTRKPSARRDIIEIQKNDPKIGVFAVQNLFAKSWFQTDPGTIEAIFAEMIDKVNRGAADMGEAIRAAASQMNVMMNQ